MNYPQLAQSKMILMSRLADVKKGPAWSRRVSVVRELMEEMLGHIRKVEAENDELRRAIGRPKL